MSILATYDCDVLVQVWGAGNIKVESIIRGLKIILFLSHVIDVECFESLFETEKIELR